MKNEKKNILHNENENETLIYDHESRKSIYNNKRK